MKIPPGLAFLAVGASQHARQLTGADDWDRAARLVTDTDAAELATIHATQARNRSAAYLRRRPARYANARYERLTAHQDPRGQVSRWWEHGPLVLTLAGPTRTGKTTAAYAIANHIHATCQGHTDAPGHICKYAWVLVWTAADLSAALKPDGDETAYDQAVSCDLLVLDDLGRERVTDWWREQLQRLVDTRSANEQRLIVTTNLASDPERAYEELVERYGDPIAERLIDDGGLVALDGPQVRRVVQEW